MPNKISPLLSLIADVHGPQKMPSMFDTVGRKSVFAQFLNNDALKVHKNLDTWDSNLSHESSAYEEII